MSEEKNSKSIEELENEEWLYSLDYVLKNGGPKRVVEILHQLQIRAHKAGVEIPFTANTPYINTIPREKQPPFPGNREIERRIKSILRWNAMAMVVGLIGTIDGFFASFVVNGCPLFARLQFMPSSVLTSYQTLFILS